MQTSTIPPFHLVATANRQDSSDGSASSQSSNIEAVLQVLRQALFQSPSAGVVANSTAESNTMQVIESPELYKNNVLLSNPIFYQKAAHTINSPFSPANEKSALYPDGLFDWNGWTSRYRSVIPASLILVLPLWESASYADVSSDKDPLGASSSGVSGLERDHDSITGADINSYKNAIANLVGSKLVVVLVVKANASKETQFAIDDRINFLKKYCNMDRSSFILIHTSTNPVSGKPRIGDKAADELVKMIRDASNSFYKEKERKMKKKRQKISSKPPLPLPSSLSSSSSSSDAKTVSAAVWNIRYDLKIGVFAEMRRDWEVAIKAYEACYSGLLKLMTYSISDVTDSNLIDSFIISPWTSRWFEARQLLDTIAFKIINCFFELKSGAEATQRFRSHISGCRDFFEFDSSTWPCKKMDTHLTISKEFIRDKVSGLSVPLSLVTNVGSISYWEWISKLYRMLGDLLEVSPHHLTAAPVAGTAYHNFTAQHEGYYFYLAAKCQEVRWELFKNEFDLETIKSLAASPLSDTSPIEVLLSSEAVVDHSSLVIELLTKSYEAFKKRKGVRMTLFLASEIARIYQANLQYDMALKFYDRISKSYRKECWYDLLSSICTRLFDCAVQVHNVQRQLECQVEMIHPVLAVASNYMAAAKETEKAASIYPTLSTLVSTLSSPAHVDMNQLVSFLDCDVQFQISPWQLHASVTIQLVLESMLDVAVEKLVLVFADSDLKLIFKNPSVSLSVDEGNTVGRAASKYRLLTGALDTAVSLSSVIYLPLFLKSGIKHIYQVSFYPPVTQQLLRVDSVKLYPAFGGQNSSIPCHLCLEFKLSDRPTKLAYTKWFYKRENDLVTWKTTSRRVDSREIRLEQREPNVSISTLPQTLPVFYLDEYSKLELAVVNNEDVEVHLIIILKIYAGHGTIETDHDCVAAIYSDTEGKFISAPVVHVDFGILKPKQSLSKPVYVRCNAKSGHRTIIPTIYVSLSPSVQDQLKKLSEIEFDITDHSLLWRDFDEIGVRFETPFEFRSSCQYAPFLGTRGSVVDKGVVSLVPHFKQVFSRTMNWIVQSSFRLSAFDSIHIESVSLIPLETKIPGVEIEMTSIGDWHQGKVWNPKDLVSFSHSLTISLQGGVSVSQANTPITPGYLQVRWRRPGNTVISISRFELPKVAPNEFLLKIIVPDLPGLVQNGKAFKALYEVENQTRHVADLLLFFESCEDFCFSGYRSRWCRLLPFSRHTISLQLFPTKPVGRASLPRLYAIKRSDANSQESGTGAAGTENKAMLEKAFPLLIDQCSQFSDQSVGGTKGRQPFTSVF